VTDYLARAMEQEEDGERRETAAPELAEVHGGLFWKDTEEETGRMMGGGAGVEAVEARRTATTPPSWGHRDPYRGTWVDEGSMTDWLAEALERWTEGAGTAHRRGGGAALSGRRALRRKREENIGPYEGYATDRTVAGVSVSGREAEDSLPLLAEVRRAQAGADFVRGQRRAFSVTLPEAPAPTPGWTAEELDRAVERDARRYDGGFPLY